MKYKWKQQQVTGLSAQTVGEELERLEKEYEGTLIPSTIVRAAKPKKSVLHKCFEWDDKVAGMKYRENQARELLRKIVVVYKEKGESKTIRAFVNIKHESESYYTHTSRVADDEELQNNVLEQIATELLAVKKKYNQFKSPKLQKIWDAVDELILTS